MQNYFVSLNSTCRDVRLGVGGEVLWVFLLQFMLICNTHCWQKVEIWLIHCCGQADESGYGMAVTWRVIEQFSHELVSLFLSILFSINSNNCALQSEVVLHILLCLLFKTFSSSFSLDWDIPDLSHSSTQMNSNYMSWPQGRSKFIS